jgi:hypothetical protein
MPRAGRAVIDLAEGRVTAPDGATTELRRQSSEVLRLLAGRAGVAAAHGMLGDVEAARAAADELRAMLPGFDLDLHVKRWLEPGLRQRLHDGAVRAGLGGAAVADR